MSNSITMMSHLYEERMKKIPLKLVFIICKHCSYGQNRFSYIMTTNITHYLPIK